MEEALVVKYILYASSIQLGLVHIVDCQLVQ